MELIDTHCHIYEPEFDGDRIETFARALEAGVATMLLPAIDGESYERMFDFGRTHADRTRVMMGLHPTSVNDNPHWREDLAAVERLLDCPPAGIGGFCAVGEIGLDFYWSGDFRAEQTEVFVAQCRMAVQRDLPVAIHTRSAWVEMCEILESEHARAQAAGGRLRGVLHAFSEDVATYRRLKSLGDFLFGIGGVVTYKKSVVATAVPEMSLEDLVLETDCPYLTPVPHRGKRNEPAYVAHTCRRVAELKGVTPEEVAAATTANARRLFGLSAE